MRKAKARRKKKIRNISNKQTGTVKQKALIIFKQKRKKEKENENKKKKKH